MLATSSSDLVLVAARAELLVGDRKSDVPFFHRHTVRVESDYNRSGRVRCNAKILIISSFNVDFLLCGIDSPSISRAVSPHVINTFIFSFSVSERLRRTLFPVVSPRYYLHGVRYLNTARLNFCIFFLTITARISIHIPDGHRYYTN